jgi:hypothetical protein
MVADKSGHTAVVYSAVTLYGPKLLLLDFDTGPMRAGLFSDMKQRIKELGSQCRAGTMQAFVPEDMARHAVAAGLGVREIPRDWDPEELLLSVSNHVSSGQVKICDPAVEKAKTSTFGGALDFRAGENTEDPLRAAAILTVALGLDDAA